MNRVALWLDGGETGDHWVVVAEVVAWNEGDGETRIGCRNGEVIVVAGSHGTAIARAVTGITDWERPPSNTAGPVSIDANGAPV